MEESDASAVAEAQAGDQEACRLLVERHSLSVFRLAYRMTGHEQDAEDLVQETFLRAFKQLPRFEGRANFLTWLHRITVNAALDLLRRRQRRPPSLSTEGPAAEAQDPVASLPAGTPAPDRQLLHLEIGEQVQAALDLLTPLERAAFVLRHFEEKSIAEISNALGLGENAAKQAIFRAIQKMRRTLQPLVNPN